ncbi:BspA family leucine-rich repeat surface protein [Lacticaseibacillus yichunensis]|uniref:BspA family leucine-rich repeat surface protein n=1 Tax=Lacticaseibacillus yichunensis TaxID=2486015 RepID=A0ABW4CQR3_9LACO
MTQGQYRCDQKRNYKKKRFDEQTHKWVTVVALLAIGTTAGVVAQTPLSGTNVQTVRAADADSDGHYQLTYTDPSTGASTVIQDIAESGQPGTVISDAANDTYSADNINTAAGALGSGDLASYVLADDPFGENPLPAMTISADASDDQVLQLQRVVAKGIWGTCHWYIDTDNVLHIGPGTGMDTTTSPVVDPDGLHTWTYSPWEAFQTTIKKISVEGHVKLPAISAYLFGNVNTIRSWSSLTSVTGLENFDTSAVTDMSGMFSYDDKLTQIEGLNNWDTANVTSFKNTFSYMGSRTSTISADLSDWNTSNVTTMQNMFLQTGFVNVGSLSTWKTGKVTDMRSMFSYAKLTSPLDLSDWDMSHVTTIALMFNNTSWISSIGDLSNWNVSNITDMSSAFNSMKAVNTLGDLTNWDVSNVTNLTTTFNSLVLVPSLGDLSNWDISNVTTLNGTFGNDYVLTSLGDLSNWDTSNVTNLMSTFSKDAILTSLGDISNWDTSKVTTMQNLFSGDAAIEVLDLEGWDTSSIPVIKTTNTSGMFDNMTSLHQITFGPGFVNTTTLPNGNETRWWLSVDNGTVDNPEGLTNLTSPTPNSKGVYFSTFAGGPAGTYVFAIQTDSATATFVDDDDGGKTVGTQTITGERGTDVAYTLDVPENYQLTPDENATGSVTVTHDDTDDFTVHLTHKHTTDQQSKTITRKITVTKPDNTVTTINQSVTYNRTVSYDMVTGALDASATGSWQLEDGDPSIIGDDGQPVGIWAAYTPDAIEGYQVVGSDGSTEAKQVTVDPDTTQDTEIDYTYQGATATATITYVDETGDPVGDPVTVSGNIGANVTYTPQLPGGYDYANPSDADPKTITISTGADDNVIIKVEKWHSEFPQAGSASGLVLQVAGAVALLAGAVGLLLFSRRKRER